MTTGADRTRGYLIHLAMAAALALACAWLAAAAGHHYQHTRMDPVYLLVPVNRTSLYFFPLAATMVALLALGSGRLNRALTAAAALAWLWAAGRALYWTWIARGALAWPGPDQLQRLRAEHAMPSVAVGLTAVAGLLLFAIGFVDSLSERGLQRADRVYRG